MPALSMKQRLKINGVYQISLALQVKRREQEHAPDSEDHADEGRQKACLQPSLHEEEDRSL